MADEPIEEIMQKPKWTLVDIRELTGYGTTGTTYMTLRKKDVHPVSKKKNPVKGGDIGEYDPQQVMTALAVRIENNLLKRKAQA
jgi:hypothetical protein